MNKVLVIGNLTASPEVKDVAGKNETYKKCGFTVAVGRGKDEPADFLDCEIWGKSAAALGQYCVKGDKLGIEGELRVSQWTDHEGKNCRRVFIAVTSVDYLSMRKEQKNEKNTAAGVPQRDWNHDAEPGVKM